MTKPTVSTLAVTVAELHREVVALRCRFQLSIGIGARDITDIYIARAYLRMRMQDAVFCYRRQHFDNPIELARYLARYW